MYTHLLLITSKRAIERNVTKIVPAICPLFLPKEVDKTENKFLTGTVHTFGKETYNLLDINTHIYT